MLKELKNSRCRMSENEVELCDYYKVSFFIVNDVDESSLKF